MSKQVTVIATMTAKADKIEEFAAVFAALVSPSRAEEGCLNYDLHQSNSNPAVWVMYENWRSQEALDKHNATAHFQNFIQQLKAKDLLAVSPDVQLFTMKSERAPFKV